MRQTYQVWYMTPAFFQSGGILGYKYLLSKNVHVDPDNLAKTHIPLMDVDADSLEQLYQDMQGEVWSPNGEARSLIEKKGLMHTSMSCGDIAVDASGSVYMVDIVGFVKLKVGL